MSAAIVQQFVTGLKSRQREVQTKAAQDLFMYVKTELGEMPQDDLMQFFDIFNHHIIDMLNSADINEKKGGVLAISEYRTKFFFKFFFTSIHFLIFNFLKPYFEGAYTLKKNCT